MRAILLCLLPAAVSEGTRGFSVEQSLVLDVMRGTSTKGSDVRISTGELFNPSGWPRMPVPAKWWRWRTAVQFKWQADAHINELEMRAFLSALRWRLRAVCNLECKFLHLLDSQVSIAVLVKHRSGSRRLNRVARKVSSLELASGAVAILGFCRSSDNPADAPSRTKDDHAS